MEEICKNSIDTSKIKAPERKILSDFFETKQIECSKGQDKRV